MTIKLRNILVSLAALTTVMVPALAVAPTAFAASGIQGALCAGSNLDISGAQETCPANASTSTFNKFLTTIINIFSAIVGVIAVIMIIVGGLRYITSGGDANKVGAAKQTLIYAIIGLVVVALAQLIVHFVLNQAITLGS